MKNLVKTIFVLLFCFTFSAYAYGQNETVPIELNTSLSFEATSSEAPGSEFFFSYEGKAGEHLVIYIVPDTLSSSDMRGTLEVRSSNGSALNRNFSIYESIWYLPSDDTYTIYVASTTPDTFEITISNPVELEIGVPYEGTANNSLNQFFIIQTEAQFALSIDYNHTENAPSFVSMKISGQDRGYPSQFFSSSSFEELSVILPERETPFYLIELDFMHHFLGEYESSRFTIEVFTPEN